MHHAANGIAAGIYGLRQLQLRSAAGSSPDGLSSPAACCRLYIEASVQSFQHNRLNCLAPNVRILHDTCTESSPNSIVARFIVSPQTSEYSGSIAQGRSNAAISCAFAWWNGKIPCFFKDDSFCSTCVHLYVVKHVETKLSTGQSAEKQYFCW